MSLSFPRIAIVGSGALGCYYGARLQLAGAEVNFLMRSDYDVVKHQGLTVQWPKEKHHFPAPRIFARPEDIGPVDLVVVALKTTAAAVYADLIRPLVGEHTAIVTLQNGLGADRDLAGHFGAERILGALCFICVNRLSPGVVECFRTGSIAFGEYGRPAGDRVRNLAAQFSAAGIQTEVGDDLELLRWRKLVWNVPFNGLSIARGGVTTDVLLSTPSGEAEVRGLMEEVVAVALKLGHRLPDDVIETNVERTRPMGPYKPSSLIDYLAGREVEVDSIWGEPLRAARAAGVSTPKLHALHQELLELTRPR